MEVLVATAVLGFLLAGLMILQRGNRDSLLRIRARDGANIVAQQAIDSLASLGIASVPATAGTPITFEKVRTWEGTPGLGSHSMTVHYSVSVEVSHDSTYRSAERSLYDTLQHVYAKHLDVRVSWQFKSSEQSINVSGVIR
jgi:type II secretory pathway pseudopilin PulG